jgi:SPX domain protein involved in polyphosphate accumulation
MDPLWTPYGPPYLQVRQDLLPGDSQLTNSTYFDNSSLELYHGRLDKKPNAIAIRMRWYAQRYHDEAMMIL